MARARPATEPPSGLVYRAGIVSEAEEQRLLTRFAELRFEEIRMKGVVARRTAVRYGLGYDYDRRIPIEGAAPIPDWLEPVRERSAELAGIRSEELVQVLVQRYPEGAPIGWHRDSPAYEIVAGISLLGAARLRLRRGPSGERVGYELTLEPRSGYVLAGESRWKWEHHIPPAKSLRYSITLRSLRARG
jgi:alkylated DNA repair protein (DNA oxidative demethylase)